MPRSQRKVLAMALVMLVALASRDGGAVTFPKRRLTDLSAGYLSATIGGAGFRGSAVIAKDPRLLFSCAHVLFENGQWSTNYLFTPGYHGAFPPDGGIAPRGVRYFSSYAGNVARFGANASQTYNLDFVVMYGYEGFGNAVGYWQDGGPILQDTNYFKRIVGYPASIDFTGASGEFYQHSTDYFDDAAFELAPAYYSFNNVSTGGGNSGGPVYAYSDGTDYLAGILVSGSETSAGVRAIDSAALTMAADALADVSASQGAVKSGSFKLSRAFTLPDNATRYTVRAFSTRLAGVITKLLLSINITTTYRGDLDVYLRAPSGRVQWVSKHGRDAADNLIRRNANFTTTFRGRAAGGRWQLFMRDASAGDRARFNSATLTISARQ